MAVRSPKATSITDAQGATHFNSIIANPSSATVLHSCVASDNELSQLLQEKSAKILPRVLK